MIFDRQATAGILLVGLLSMSIPAAHAEPTFRAGGSLGFGMSTTRQNGSFKWDFNSQQEIVDLIRLKLEASPAEGFIGFVRLDAPLGFVDDPPELELGEASLRYRRPLGTAGHISVRAFARQPQSLWLDQTLGAPIDPRQVGDDVLGLRATLLWKNIFATVLAADPATQATDVGPQDDPFTVVRLGGELPGKLRLGGTWMRESPHVASLNPATTPSDAGNDVLPQRDYGSIDVTWQFAGLLFLADYAQTTPKDDAGADAVSSIPLAQPHGLLDRLPDTAALRAEVRAVSLGNARWGWFGLAPSLRVIGSKHAQRNHQRPPQWGTPRRGFQAWHVEAWYRASHWPLWIRQVFDRNETFVDANRRIDLQLTELEGRLSHNLRGRLRWRQRQVVETSGRRFHGDLLADIWLEEINRRLRVQFGWIDIDLPTERQSIAMEFSSPIIGKWNAVVRSAMTRESTRLRQSLFAELQYWHLPRFEFAVAYGSEVFGNRADPVLDGDQIAAADTRNVVRIHFRGWF